jgi:hypothetical protein
VKRNFSKDKILAVNNKFYFVFFTEMTSKTEMTSITPQSHNETNLIHENQCLLDSGSINDPLELLRTNCLARGFSGFLAFNRALRHADHGENRFLSMRQFRNAMHKTGFKLSDDEIDEIFYRFEVFGNEGLDIAHVLEAVKVRKIAR